MPESPKNEINKYDTWPKLLQYNSQRYGSSKAMRYKHYGIWQTYTWQDYYQKVKYLALGLLSLGFKAGDKLLIIGDNAPEWYFAELAAQSNLGVSVGLYSDLSPSEIKYLASNSEASFAVVQDQEQVDKLLEILNDLPRLKKIIFWNFKGLANNKNSILAGYQAVLQAGKDYEKEYPNLFEGNIAKGKASDICALIYTSGSTCKEPRCAVHSHFTLRCGSENYILHDKWTEKDNLISYLPPAWVTEQWLSFGCHLLSGGVVNFSEGAETQQQDIREIGPTVILYNARMWERQAGAVQARIQGTDFLKKSVYRLLMPIGYKIADLKIKKQKPGLYERLLFPLAYLLVFRPIKDSLGLPHARICYTAGSTLSPDAIRFYHALNIPLKSHYGSTEAGAVTGNKNENTRFDTVGTINRETEVRITKNGEILCRQQGVFLGYFNDPEGTRQTMQNDWISTGDSGSLNEDGELVFFDRSKDIVNLKNGEKIFPQQIESQLKFSPYIKDAWVFSDPNGSYVSAVIIIDNNGVGKWADKRKVSYTTFSDLSQKSEVYGLVEQEIRRINDSLTMGCRIKKFVNLHKEFDADEFELTRNRKLRRGFLAERYKDLIRDIYSSRKEIAVETQVSYRDGRTGTLKTSVQIMDVGEAVK